MKHMVEHIDPKVFFIGYPAFIIALIIAGYLVLAAAQ